MVEHVKPLPDGLVAAPAALPSNGGRIARIADRISSEALLFPVVALYLIAIFGALPQQLLSDSWYAVLGGHEIVHHGLPAGDALTIWTHGQQWVDQQWLGQLFFYGLYAAGGIKLALFGHAAAASAAFALAIVFARRHGGSVRTICWLAIPTIFLIIWGSWNARAQSLAFVLFVGLVWLLVTDARAQSRRVLLVFPILILWANVHGSAVTGALLVVLAGLSYGFDRRKDAWQSWLPRAAMLSGAPIACLVASPYALKLPEYYRHVLVNPGFRDYILEWQPTTPGLKTAPFYLLAFIAAWLVGRRGDRLTSFEKVVLVSTILIGLQSLRGVIWFSLAAFMLLPRLLGGGGELTPAGSTARLRFASGALAALSVLVVAATVATVAAKPASWFERHYPEGALAAVQRAEVRQPRVQIFASTQYSDWLLLRLPDLTGRIAYDARFELMPTYRLRQLVDVQRQVAGWQKVVAPFGLFVLKDGAADEGSLIKGLLQVEHARVLYRGNGAVVLSRPVKRGLGG
jgi:hypothetical protein